MYENTGPRAHVMAADLIEAGVDVHEIYRRVYEGVPYGKLALLARGLAKVERYDDGRLTVTELTRDDFARLGRRGELLRRRDRPPARRPGHRGGGAVRERDRRTATAAAAQGLAARQRRPRRRLGDRARPGRRRPPPGGRASRPRWSCTSSSSSCARRSRSSCRRRGCRRRPSVSTASSCTTSRPGSRRMTSSRGCGARSAAAARKVGHAGHARSVRDRAAADPGRPRHARPAVPDGAAQDATRQRRGSARFRPPATPRARSSTTGVRPHRRPRPSDRRRAPAPACVLGGQGRRPARVCAGSRRRARSSSPSARSRSTGSRSAWRDGDRRGFVIECSSGTYVRSLIADLGDAYCEELRRTAIGPFDVADADPERIDRPRRTRSRSCPRSGSTPSGARRAAHGGAVAAETPAGAMSSGSPTRTA